MKERVATVFGTMAIIGIAIGGMTPRAAHAWGISIQLYRCTMEARPTVCYGAGTGISRFPESPARGGELCQSEEISVHTNAVYGGGLGFFDPPGADSQKATWHECNYSYTDASTGYTGFIRPCAPGGPSGWRHMTTHYVIWRAGSTYGYGPIDFRNGEKHLPLPTTTCPEGGGGPLQ